MIASVFSAVCCAGFAIAGLGCDSKRDPDVAAAEAAVNAFYVALFTQNWEAAADVFHPEGQQLVKDMLVHIAVTSSAAERKATYGMVGARSLWQMKQLDRRVCFLRCFRYFWENVPEFTHNMWRKSTIEIVGSVREGDSIHVVFRVRVDLPDVKATTISVATAKRDAGVWKLLSSSEMQGLTQGLRR